MSHARLILPSFLASLLLSAGLCLASDALADPAPPAAIPAAALEQFENNVRPLLIARCQKCHGADKAENGLKLDSAVAIANGGDSGPAVMPGNPDESLLIQAVRQTGDVKMPPDGKLSDQEIAELVAWVAAGAVWPDDSGALPPTAAQAGIPPIEPNAAELAGSLETWLRADAFAHPDNEPVVVWPDQSGHGRDLAATKGVRPDGTGLPPRFVAQSSVSRRPAVRFEPASGLAASPGNPVAIQGDAAFTFVLVMNLQPNDVQPPFDGVLGLGDPAAAGDPGRPLAALVQINRDETNHSLRLAGGWNHDASLGIESYRPLYGRPIILTIVKSPGPMKDTTRFFINGDRSDEAPLNRPVEGRDTVPDVQHRADIGVYMGHAQSWCGSFRGDVAEAIVYSAALVDDQRAGLESHLAEKYGITLESQVRATRVAFSPEQKAHWAFQPVTDQVPPNVRDESATPVDRFILAKLAEQGLQPSPPAEKRALIRRVTFDLTGLPPTPEEIEAFLKDESPQAFDQLVERLLASPHYGERWGRHWLDVVRYAETTANDANCVMRYAYRYRDYVVDAFNRDLPYDQFIVEQLAGDLLVSSTGGEPPRMDADATSAYIRRVIATGFLMIGPKALAETDKEQSRLDIVDDQIDVTGRAFLGLTVACARCHDHKFDPIPTVDYYAWAGILRSTEPFQDEVRNATMWWEFPLFTVPGQEPFIVMAPKETAPRNLRVHLRGNRFTLGPVAPRRVLQILSSPDAPSLQTTASGRLELARWIASRDNPLTARVMANRVWQHHFGVGLVATSDNFGRRGEAPSHPELLDFLAARFVESGWSVKALHRLMLLSKTYQQQSAVNEPSQRIDPDNRLLWRMPRHRLEAEAIRDAMLAVSGRLEDRTVGGGEGSEVLYKAADQLDAKRGFVTNSVQSNHPFYVTSTRRSIYLPVVRNALPDVLALFDAADPNGVTARRSDTTVPSQALYSLNNPFVKEQAGALAQRLLADQALTDEARIARAFDSALGRPPSPDEISEALAYLESYRTAPATRTRPEKEWTFTAWQSYCQMLLCLNEFLYVD